MGNTSSAHAFASPRQRHSAISDTAVVGYVLRGHLQRKNALFVLTLKWRSKFASVKSTIAWSTSSMPAFATTISRWPTCSIGRFSKRHCRIRQLSELTGTMFLALARTDKPASSFFVRLRERSAFNVPPESSTLSFRKRLNSATHCSSVRLRTVGTQSFCPANR